MSGRTVSLKDRAIRVGNIIGINGYRLQRDSLRQYFTGIGYTIHQTSHFLLCQHISQPTIVIHWFAPEQMDVNIGYYVTEELKAFGVLTQVDQFDDIFGAILLSLSPHDVEKAVYLFGINTLQRYHELLLSPEKSTLSRSTLDIFAHLYRRICELHVGNSLLDAGCSFGFLSLLIAERVPSLTRILGLDIQSRPFEVTRQIAQERRWHHVEFCQADLLTTDIKTFGRFDTVVLLHVLEHFTENEMYEILSRLLAVTVRRLIIAVPFEGNTVETMYGHKQLFARNKLEDVGRWCLQQWGTGQISYEDCEDGLLFIDRESFDEERTTI